MTTSRQGNIDTLEDALWQSCVRQRAATSQQQMDRWQNDERAHLSERFLITLAPSEYAPQIEAALAEWDAIESAILAPPQHGSFLWPAKDRNVFLDEFAAARSLHLTGTALPESLMRLCLSLTGKVRNMDWVNLFALVLPAADPEQREGHLARARMVVAIFYLEQIGKMFLASDSPVEEALRKIEGRWQLVAPPNPRLMSVATLNGHFWVPSYQRGYRWGKEEVEALLNDLHEFIIADKRTPRGEIYCLQPVVVKTSMKGATDEQPEAVPEGETYHELIDGQQRITTLYLLYRYLATQGQPTPNFWLSYETRPDSTGFLTAVNGQINDTNVDYFHMSAAFALIEAWFEEDHWPDEKERLRAPSDWCGYLADRIQLIWYDAGQQDAIDIFTRLNAGRIALTNAELVKALLLADHGQADARQQTIRGNQWDEIEHAMHEDAFWYFLSNDAPQSYPTRIDLLLDLIAEKTRTRNDSFATFVWFQEQLKGRGNSQEALLKRIWELYTLLRDWFQDQSIYHRIGWLIATGEKLSVVMNECLAQKGQSRSAFQKSLDDRIRRRLDLSSIDAINYRTNKNKCEGLLLLFNVMSVSALEHGDARYPFDTHHKEGWSLEHIHAQAAQPPDREDAWRAWLVDSGKTLKSLRLDANGPDCQEAEQLSADLDASLAGMTIGGPRFHALEQRITAFLNRHNANKDPDAIDNLALLSSDINTSLGNQSFPAKRLRLLDYDKAARFIPPCTRRVFLKYYTESGDQQLQIWSDADRKAYRDAIRAVVSPYL